MTRTITATDSRVHFGELIQHIDSDREDILVDKDGEVSAIATSPDVLEALEQSRRLADWVKQVHEAREIVTRALGGRKPPSARELIDGGRDDVDDE